MEFHGTASTPPAFLLQNMGVSVLFIVCSPSDDEMFVFFPSTLDPFDNILPWLGR